MALTAYAMHGNKEKFIEAGMDEYMPEPVEHARIKGVIRRVMAKESK